MTRLHRLLALALMALLLGGCGRGPDAAQLQAGLQAKLDQLFPGGIFALVALNRQGSVPDGAAPFGEQRRIVYFGAVIAFTKDYDFSNWQGPNFAMLAEALGATPKGIFGVKRGGNKAGDQLKVYGTAVFRAQDGDWIAVPPKHDASPDALALDNTAPPSPARQILARIAEALGAVPPETSGVEDPIFADELDTAWGNIRLRLDRARAGFGLVTGPSEGEYFKIGSALEAHWRARKIPFSNVASAGSLENIRLMKAGTAQYAIVQNDVAAMAYAGQGPFEDEGAAPGLRALASLFPEPVQLVVRADGPIKTIADLKGRRVNLGPSGSGSEINAIEVIRAAGLDALDLAAIQETDASLALADLEAGRTDAVFQTIGAPASRLSDLAARMPTRLIGLDEQTISQVVRDDPALIAYTLPPGVYPGQVEAVKTIAAAALMVADWRTPESEVTALLKALFRDIDFARFGSVQGVEITLGTARTGITIPLHPAAEAFYQSAVSP